MSINDARVQRIARHGYPITVLRPDGTVLYAGTPARNLAWQDHASCLNLGEDGRNKFFPEVGRGGNYARRRHCNRCVVHAACLEHALATGVEHGIWGGLWAKHPLFKRLRNLRRAMASGRID